MPKVTLLRGGRRVLQPGSRKALTITPKSSQEERARARVRILHEMENDPEAQRIDAEALAAKPRPPRPDQSLPVIVQACGRAETSLRLVSEGMLEGLRQLGIEVQSVPEKTEPPADAVWVTWGLGRGGGAPVCAMVDPVDGWRWEESRVRDRNAVADVVFGLSASSCEAIRGLGVHNVEYLPLSVDSESMYPEANPPIPACIDIPRDKRFWFVTVAAISARKGIEDLVQAYTEEFDADEPVGLLIKAQHVAWGRDRRDIVTELPPGGPPVIYCAPDLTRDEMRQLYSAAGAYVTVSRLEGWGLPPMEALACGCPVIATDYSGHQEYLTAENATLIPVREESMKDVPPENGLASDVAAQLKWGVPDVADIRTAMRDVYTTHPQRSGAERVKRWFTLAYQALKVVESLESRGIQLQRSARPPAEKLPRVAVAIPTRDDRELTLTCLEALEQTEGVDFTVLVHDDGSSDGTASAIRKREWKFPCRVSGTKAWKGLFHARKMLVKKAQALDPQPEFLCFLAADAFSQGNPKPGGLLDINMPDPLWLAKLASNHIDGVSTGKVLCAQEGQIWEAGLFYRPTASDELNIHARGRNEWDDGQYDFPCEIDVASGALMFLRLDLFSSGAVTIATKYGKRGHDDCDICMQVQRHGEHVWFWPDVEIAHNSWGQRNDASDELDIWKKEAAKSRKSFLALWGKHIGRNPGTRQSRALGGVPDAVAEKLNSGGGIRNEKARTARAVSGPPWHVVFASPCWFRGGLESVTLSHLRHLKDLPDWKVSLVVGKSDEMRTEVPSDITFIEDRDLFEWTQGNPAATIRAALRAESLFRKMAPDVVVSSLCHGALYGAEAAGVPLICEYWHLGWGWDGLKHPSDYAMAVSAFVAQRVREVRPQMPPATVIHNGTNCKLFKPASKDERRAAKARFELGDAPVVGYSGRISPEKKPLAWLECFARIRERIPEARGLVAGAQFAKGLENQFFDKAKAAGLKLGEDLVHVAVNHSDMPELYRAMDVLMHMRHDEPFGMIFPEAIMTGTPVVGFAGGGVPEIAKKLPDGLDLAPVGDNDAVIDLVCEKLKSRARVSEQGMHACRKKFSDEVMTARVEDFLREKIEALQDNEEDVAQ